MRKYAVSNNVYQGMDNDSYGWSASSCDIILHSITVYNNYHPTTVDTNTSS